MDINILQVDLIRVKSSSWDYFFSLYDTNLSSGCGIRIKVTRSLAELYVTLLVDSPGLNDGEISSDGSLKNVLTSIIQALLLLV